MIKNISKTKSQRNLKNKLFFFLRIKTNIKDKPKPKKLHNNQWRVET